MIDKLALAYGLSEHGQKPFHISGAYHRDWFDKQLITFAGYSSVGACYYFTEKGKAHYEAIAQDIDVCCAKVLL